MGGLRPKQLARIGMFYIEEAILDLLLEAEMDKRQGLGPTELARGLALCCQEVISEMLSLPVF